MVKCESLRINMFRITHTEKISKFSRNTVYPEIKSRKSFVLLKKNTFRKNPWLQEGKLYVESYKELHPSQRSIRHNLFTQRIWGFSLTSLMILYVSWRTCSRNSEILSDYKRFTLTDTFSCETLAFLMSHLTCLRTICRKEHSQFVLDPRCQNPKWQYIVSPKDLFLDRRCLTFVCNRENWWVPTERIRAASNHIVRFPLPPHVR